METTKMSKFMDMLEEVGRSLMRATRYGLEALSTMSWPALLLTAVFLALFLTILPLALTLFIIFVAVKLIVNGMRGKPEQDDNVIDVK